jgi:hypothetical protein
MNKPNPELLALVYLSAKGISRKSLLDAASFFPVDEDTTEGLTAKDTKTEGTSGEVATPEMPTRGRPTKESLKLAAFYFYVESLNETGTLPTNPIVTERLERARNSVLKMFTEGEQSKILTEFLTEVKETTVKQWRREFEKLRVENKDDWDEIYRRLRIESQKSSESQK